MTTRQPSRFLSIRFFLVLPVLLFLTLLLGQAQEAYAQKVATLEKVSGNVRVFKEGSSRGKKGRNGMALFVNSIVHTLDASAQADIVYIKGGAVRVMPNSKVALSTAEFDGDRVNAKLNLSAGKIFNVVNKLAKGSTYEVQTYTATVGVKGTIFSVETTRQRSVFMVKEGTVEVEGANQPVLVSDLKKTTVNANQPPGQPEELTPEEIAMFDILDDLMEEIKSDLKEEVQESIKEDIIQDAIEGMEMDTGMDDMH